MIKRHLIIGIVGMILLVSIPTSIAQEGAPLPPTPPLPDEANTMLIHVVQRNETLSHIAQRYGTTIQAIMGVNSILVADNLQVGQRLIIPIQRADTLGLLMAHIVEPGETIHTIATRYNSTPQSLAEANRVTSSGSLYVGQNLLVTQGANGTLPADVVSLHVVEAGETWAQVAMRYQVPMLTLAQTNDIPPHTPLQPGQWLIIPDVAMGKRFVKLPAPISDVQIAPLPIEQGRTLSVYVQTAPDTTLVGRMFDREIRFSVASPTEHYAIIGVHSFTEAGIYPLVIEARQLDGTSITYSSRVRVLGGGYGQEDITIPDDRSDLLNPQLVQAELDRVAAIMTGFTETKYFDGVMNLPSIGPITSQYGTRRSYNGSSYDTFHGGADFGGAPGSPITAPADGVVVMAETLNIRGNTIIIDHGWGVYTGYWHNTDLFVDVGQTVQRGEVISTLGATGLVTGAHLHWEMWVNGVQVDPLQWLIHPFDTFTPQDTPEAPGAPFPSSS